jgi:general secretion pathway protein B
MSYILNALRKSEQERLQNQQENSLQANLAVEGTERQRLWLGWLVAGLVVVNLAGLTYILTQTDRDKPTTPAQNPSLSLQPKIEIKTIELPAITEIAGSEKEHALPITAESKTEKPDTTESFRELIEDKSRPASIKAKPEIKNISTKIIAEPVVESRKISAQQPPVQHEIPWLSELPATFRRSVPWLNINVYVYADNPDNRFIMVDMQKYGNDQEIREGMILKAIHPDGIVVEYRQKTFKIKRD